MKRWLLIPFLLCLCGSAAAVAAPSIETPPQTSSPAETVRRFVDAELARSQPRLRAEISIGEIDPHLRLAPCERTEAFLRPGGRLWGRSFVGLRCLQHPGWSISVPVTVRLYGMALVAEQPLPALQPISASAVRQQEVEVTREPGGVVVEAQQLEDRVCTRSLEVGQPIPLNSLRTLPAVGQGDPVKLIGVGSGFSISTEATALATVAAGELVRVRTDSGRTVSGIARKGRVVEVSF
ncbi:putative Flagella basal body P-ring formation protein FlgA [Burkholderiales bacterium]|nr:putative Flagella basal body P-ring formation protein FlgA [Burkholderiales bacterium]